jgi:hypothetical protein
MDGALGQTTILFSPCLRFLAVIAVFFTRVNMAQDNTAWKARF